MVAAVGGQVPVELTGLGCRQHLQRRPEARIGRVIGRVLDLGHERVGLTVIDLHGLVQDEGRIRRIRLERAALAPLPGQLHRRDRTRVARRTVRKPDRVRIHALHHQGHIRTLGILEMHRIGAQGEQHRRLLGLRRRLSRARRHPRRRRRQRRRIANRGELLEHGRTVPDRSPASEAAHRCDGSVPHM